MQTRHTLVCLIALTVLAGSVQPVAAIDDAHYSKGRESIDKAIAFLRGAQNEDGSWSPQIGPAITALVVTAMLDEPDISASDPAVKKGIDFILSFAKEDGSIHSGIVENYSTSICLSALSRVRSDPRVAEVLKRGEGYLRGLQYDEADKDENGRTVDKAHPFFGGFGYGKHGRPDLSNTQFAVQALHDMGVDCEDPAFQNAMTFITRLQGTPMNKEYGDKIEQDGGAIYATSVNKDNIGIPQSMASPEQIDRVKEGQPINARLRTYGSMTYAMFKSYIYADLARDDERVVNAFKWIQKNYTFDQNPGMPEAVKMQGYYYNLNVMARALAAYGRENIETADGKVRNWENDMVDALVKRQRQDGAWVNEEDRWNESDPNLVTAYCVIALQNAMR